MLMDKWRGRRRSVPAAGGQYRVVAHRPVWRAVAAAGVALVVMIAAALGYWLGAATRDLDATYLDALETRERALEAEVDALTRQLADSRLAQNVDAEAARSLRDTISEMQERIGGLREEVTFYKSLMAPSSIERGLQIAEFDLGRGEGDDTFVYHLLLTQAEERRSWVSGRARIAVEGLRTREDGSVAEESLPLSDLTSLEEYPLRFRFRYFQDFEGQLTLPEGFRPRTVVVSVAPSGGGAEPAERRFDWIVETT